MRVAALIKSARTDAQKAASLANRPPAYQNVASITGLSDKAIASTGELAGMIAKTPGLVSDRNRIALQHTATVVQMAGKDLERAGSYAVTQVGARLGVSATQLRQAVGAASAVAGLVGATSLSDGLASLGGFLSIFASPYLLELSSETRTFRFSADQAPYETLRRTAEYTIHEHERIGRTNAQQAAGIGAEKLEISGAIYLGTHGAGQLDTLRAMATELKPVTITTGYGEVWGRWYVRDVQEEQHYAYTDGAPRKQTFSVSLISYGEDYQDV